MICVKCAIAFQVSSLRHARPVVRRNGQQAMTTTATKTKWKRNYFLNEPLFCFSSLLDFSFCRFCFISPFYFLSAIFAWMSFQFVSLSFLANEHCAAAHVRPFACYTIFKWTRRRRPRNARQGRHWNDRHARRHACAHSRDRMRNEPFLRDIHVSFHMRFIWTLRFSPIHIWLHLCGIRWPRWARECVFLCWPGTFTGRTFLDLNVHASARTPKSLSLAVRMR